MDIIKDKDSKVSFVGISLSGLSTIESAVAVIDKYKHVVMLDKLFSMNDVKYFLDNWAGKQNSVVMVSIPENEVMLSHKWKYNSRTYDLVNFDKQMINKDDWTNRFSSRGSEYFKELKENGCDIFRFDVDNMKKIVGNCFAYKERTPIDCKSLQDTLRMKYDMRELPVNMLPVAQLEAILGALLGQMIVTENKNFEYKQIGTYENLPIIGV
ncbi:MAG: hypothetical protein IJY61_05835 [Candidatus Gastranaerophilales bacterium]|nr:hypothetical protein [Candidatus Gastranaerophilales bacterium]